MRTSPIDPSPTRSPRHACEPEGDPAFLEIGELAEQMDAGVVAPTGIVSHQLDRIARLDGGLRSFVSIAGDEALAAAQSAETELRAGLRRGPLHGVPIALKDMFWQAGKGCAAGTTVLRDEIAPRDATVVERLREAGAIVLGRLQMTEGAYSDHHPSVVPPINPWHAEYWTGISSSGPAVAVAAGLCFGALGSDTGGSIRWPAAATGLTGLKPSWGRISRDGTAALAPSLDHVGTLTRSAADAGRLFAAIAGPDPRDPTCLRSQVLLAEGDGISGLRLGIDSSSCGGDVHPLVRGVIENAAATLDRLGASLRPVAVPDVAAAIADWPDLCAVEAALVHEATFPSRRSEYGPVLASVLDRGWAVAATDFHRIQLRRAALRREFEELFEKIDLLLCPAHPFAPLSLAAIGTMGEQPELIAALQRYTVPFDMTGNPTITLPGGWDEKGLPIGFQLVAAHERDELAIRAAIAFQQVTDWHRRHPAI